MQGEVDVSLDYTIVFAGFHAIGKLIRVQPEVFGKAFESLHTPATFTLVYVQVVMVFPECTLLSGAFGGEGGQVGIVVDVRKMEISEVCQPRIHVGFLDFEGRTTGPVLAARSLKVAEIGDGNGGVQGPEDIPFPGCGRGGGCGVGLVGDGRSCSCRRNQGVGGNRLCGGIGGLVRGDGGGLR